MKAEDLVNVRLRGLSKGRRANGERYYRFYRKGRKYQIFGKPGSPLFFEHYKALLNSEEITEELQEEFRQRSFLDSFPARRISYMLTKARERSSRYSEDFDLSAAWVGKTFARQRGMCALSGIKMNYERVGSKMPYAPSIDRIDTNVGYVQSNCRIVCVAVNLARLDWPDSVFIRICKSVSRRN